MKPKTYILDIEGDQIVFKVNAEKDITDVLRTIEGLLKVEEGEDPVVFDWIEVKFFVPSYIINHLGYADGRCGITRRGKYGKLYDHWKYAITRVIEICEP